MTELFNKISTSLELNPHYGLLIAAALFGLCLIGFIKNWNWVMEPGGGWINIVWWENKVGNKTVHWFMGIHCFIAMLACLHNFYQAEF
ncbi:Imm17 family immunity protein [Aurantibacter sp.]|uniref:Imm17 family immunity protein n=1 Tax=Aurantibacter sp. TaxID=2807103 RepID=UPI0032672318